MKECENEMTGGTELRHGCGRVCILTDTINDGNLDHLNEIRTSFGISANDMEGLLDKLDELMDEVLRLISSKYDRAVYVIIGEKGGKEVYKGITETHRRIRARRMELAKKYEKTPVCVP